MTDEYKIDDIKKILKKIEAIKEKQYIEKIKEIIISENPNISFTKKSSGILLFFHNLSQNTYKRLDLFFEKLESEKLNTISVTFSENNNLSNSDDSIYDSPHVKLSNSEKKILKKKEYHKQIDNTHKDDIYVSDDEVYHSKKI
jgi:hypothetical protein